MNVRGSGAVVTGGGNGIGRALARRLAAAGAPGPGVTGVTGGERVVGAAAMPAGSFAG